MAGEADNASAAHEDESLVKLTGVAVWEFQSVLKPGWKRINDGKGCVNDGSNVVCWRAGNLSSSIRVFVIMVSS